MRLPCQMIPLDKVRNGRILFPRIGHRLAKSGARMMLPMHGLQSAKRQMRVDLRG